MGDSIELLYDSPLLSVREWHMPPCDWSGTHFIEDTGPIVVFPRVPVLIRPVDEHPVLATPNIAMLYRAGEAYHREPRDPRGDHALYIRVYGRELPRGRTIATAPETYLRQHLLARYLRTAEIDPLLVETIAASLIDLAIGGGRTEPLASPTHRRLAQEAQELLAATVHESRSLHELATGLNVSPFHLARVFRRVTGFGLHEYRRRLRLRLALQRLGDGGLTELAFALGVASHSHFTDAFGREFGLTPSAVARGDARALLAA